MSTDSLPTARAVLKPRRAMPFFGRHPWVFESAIAGVETDDGQEPPAGTRIELVSADGEFVAHGLWNPHSIIRIRLYSWEQSAPVSGELLAHRITQAVNLRATQFDLSAPETGCRLVFSEGDGLSGLIVDCYGGYLVVQFTSLALYQYREQILAALQSLVQPKGVWLRTEKGMREAEGLDSTDGLAAGEAPPRPLMIAEHGARYAVDIQEGQKTGCYLDQRDNRVAAARFAKDADVLDAFCFSGGFGITALKHGAKSVTAVDSSAAAIELAQTNATANEVGDRIEFRRNDVRSELEQMIESGRQFDMVILDPPKLARTRNGVSRALKGYQRFNQLGVRVLRPGGILVTCSCSGHVGRADFVSMLAEVSRVTRRDIQILEQHGHPADHPIAACCPESEYLKTYICRVM
ncbi:MAG: class I SAM-dependent rRNA methyltransferase [Planctomycetaceae bacterium]|nr:class I SAM-dependent rRNA methyltransferase [Planctomycetaceae bacterium]